MFKKIFENKNISLGAFFLFLFSIPLGTKKFVFSFTGSTSEFDAIFLFLSDVLFFISFILISIAFFGSLKRIFKDFFLFLKKEENL